MARWLELVQATFGPQVVQILIDSEETAAYLGKKFGVPDSLIRDLEERRQLVALAQQYAQTQQGAMGGAEQLPHDLDGYKRSRPDDEKISINIAALFKDELGKDVLKYRSITIEAVNGAAVSDAELRHMEGQRYIVGLIESRIRHGQKVKSNE